MSFRLYCFVDCELALPSQWFRKRRMTVHPPPISYLSKTILESYGNRIPIDRKFDIRRLD